MVNSLLSPAGGTTTVPIAKMTAREIADDITSRIPAEHPPGSQLVHAQLADLYDVSKSTIQRAMALLQDRGLAIYVRGIGWYVADPNET